VPQKEKKRFLALCKIFSETQDKLYYVFCKKTKDYKLLRYNDGIGNLIPEGRNEEIITRAQTKAL
jgi:hypothetical protein